MKHRMRINLYGQDPFKKFGDAESYNKKYSSLYKPSSLANRSRSLLIGPVLVFGLHVSLGVNATHDMYFISCSGVLTRRLLEGLVSARSN